MAVDLLRGIDKGSQIFQTEDHDIESFIVVIAYVVLRHLVLTSDKTETPVLMRPFKRVFGHKSIDGIASARGELFGWITEIPLVRERLSPVLYLFLGELERKMLTRRVHAEVQALQAKAQAIKAAVDPQEHIQYWSDEEEVPSSAATAAAKIRLTHDYLLKILSIAIKALEKK